MAALRVPPSLRRFNKDELPAILSRIDGRAMLRDVRTLIATDRLNSFEAFLRTARSIKAMYRRGGVSTEVIPVPTAPADGSGAWVIQEASDVRGAVVDDLSPARRRIADFERNPWCVIQWSAGTARGGVTSDLVVIDSWDGLRAAGEGSLRGKMILTRLPPHHAAHEFARTGADGILVSSAIGTGFGAPPRARQLPDATEWTKLGWGGMPMEHAGCRLVAVAVSPRIGVWLRELAARGRPVRVQARVDVRRRQGRHDLVCGVVRGAPRGTVEGGEPREEVWALAHDAEPGAADNASGVAACVAAAGAIEAAIRSGDLPRPRRSIRFLNGYECYGFFPYLLDAARETTPLAGLVVDTVGLEPSACRGRLNWHTTVDSSATFVNEIGESVIRAALSIDNPGYRLVRQPWVSTDDTLVGDPLHGFPCPWINTHYKADHVAFDQYHTSQDTPDLLSPRGLRECAAAAAAYLLYLAGAGATEAREMARSHTANVMADLSAMRGRRPRDWAELRALQHHLSMESLPRWATRGERVALQRELGALERDVREVVRRFAKASMRPAGAAAARRVPVRTRPLAPDMENLPPDVRRRLAESGLGRQPLFWVDGRRSCADIARLHAAATGKPVSVEQLGRHFEAMREAGFVTL